MTNLHLVNHRPPPPPVAPATCTLPDEDLAAFLEGRLSPPDAGEMEAHLFQCSRCRWICATSAQFLRSAWFHPE